MEQTAAFRILSDLCLVAHKHLVASVFVHNAQLSFIQHSVFALSMAWVCTCIDMSVGSQCVPVDAHLAILAGLVLLSCTRARPINWINLGEWMKMEGWWMEESCRISNT